MSDTKKAPSDSDFLRALMRNIPDHIYFKDSLSRFVKANRAMAGWFGLTDPDEVVGKTDFDYFTPEHAEQAFSDEREVMRTGQPIVGKEEKETWPNGVTTWVSTTKAPVLNGAGEVIGTLGISRDITTHKTTEQALKESEERLRSLVEHAAEIVGILGPDGTIRYQSDSVSRVLGYRPEELTGKRLTELVHPDDREAVELLLGNVLDKESSEIVRTQCRLRSANGEWRICELILRNLSFVPAVRGIVLNSRDVTESLRVESELQHRNDLLEAIFSSIQVKVAYLDSNFDFIRVNKAYAESDNRPPEFFAGKNHFELFPHSENAAIFRDVLATGRPYYAHSKPFTYARNPERGVSYWDWSLSPVRDSAGKVTGLVLCVIDVTERAKAQRELEASREGLRQLSAYLDSAIEEERRRIAHELHDELGQSLTALRLELVALSRIDSVKCEPEVARKVRNLARMVSRNLEQVRDISHELRPAILDHLGLEAAVEWLCQEFQRHSRIPCRLTSNLGEVSIDQKPSIAVYRILQEALTNAARHSDAKTVSVSLSRGEGWLNVEVADDGRGFDENLSAGPSLGILGMKERAVRVGGALNISGKRGHGTKVSARIPVETLREEGAGGRG